MITDWILDITHNFPFLMTCDISDLLLQSCSWELDIDPSEDQQYWEYWSSRTAVDLFPYVVKQIMIPSHVKQTASKQVEGFKLDTKITLQIDIVLRWCWLVRCLVACSPKRDNRLQRRPFLGSQRSFNHISQKWRLWCPVLQLVLGSMVHIRTPILSYT